MCEVGHFSKNISKHSLYYTILSVTFEGVSAIHTLQNHNFRRQRLYIMQASSILLLLLSIRKDTKAIIGMEEMSHRKKMTRKHKKLYKSTSGHYYKMKNEKKS
jgi:hypothetical protein